MRIAASAFISCCSVLVALTVISAAPADPTPISTRPPLNDNPLIQRNNVDSTIAWTAAPPEVQERIKKLLAKVLLSTPKPQFLYQISTEDMSDNIGDKIGMIKGTQRWVPIEAGAGRDYQEAGGEEVEENTAAKFLEIQVALNSTLGLTTGIASKSDKPHIREIAGAVAVEQSTVSVVDSTQADRGDTEHPEEPITLLRIYVVDPDLEIHVRKLHKETGAFPGFRPSQVLSDHPDDLRSIVISYYGLKSDVEAVAQKIDIAALRKLLPG